ncbi:MAG: copper resistance protein CopC, partial [Thermomicrobiales bacterium]|nr:copper resistance protein CopC [Thermomicrobiales bacterium]
MIAPASAPRARRLRLLLAMLALVVVALCAPPPVAFAHAALRDSDPAPNTLLTAPPAAVRMAFTEPLERVSTATLYDRDGALVPDATAAVSPDDPHVMTLSVPAGLPDGTYTVAWRTVSTADGHPLDGFFAVSIGTADAGAATIPLEPGDDSGIFAPLARWIALLGLAGALAIWPVWRFVLRPAAPNPDAVARWIGRARRFAAGTIALAAIGDALALAAQAAAVSPSGWMAGLMTTLTDTRFGRLWLLRLALLAGLAIALRFADWQRPRARALPGWAALLLVAVLPLPYSLTSHAAALEHGRITAVVNDALHLLGASLWVGGLAVLATVLLPDARGAGRADVRAAFGRVIPRFSVLALTAWGVLVLSGVYGAWLQVGSLEALWATDYGRTLLVKLALLIPLLLLGGFNLIVVRRRLRGSPPPMDGAPWVRRFVMTVGAEVALAAIVLLVVGRLIGLEPGREALAGQVPPALTLTFALGGSATTRDAALTISPGAAGRNDYRLQVDGDPLPDNTEVLLRLGLPALGIGVKDVPLTRQAGNTFTATGSELGIAGDWDAETIVREIGTFQWSAAGVLPVGMIPPPPPAAAPSTAWRFGPLGALGLLGIAFGIGFLAAAGTIRPVQLRPVVVLGVAAVGLGVIVLLQASRPLMQATSEAATVVSPPAVRTSAASSAATPPAAVSPAPEAAAIGTPVTRNGLTATLLPAAIRSAPNDLTVLLTDATGAPVDDAAVTIAARSLGMDMGVTTKQAESLGEGRYTATVPMGMAGEWRITIRVAPRGEASV